MLGIKRQNLGTQLMLRVVEVFIQISLKIILFELILKSFKVYGVELHIWFDVQYTLTTISFLKPFLCFQIKSFNKDLFSVDCLICLNRPWRVSIKANETFIISHLQ